jgi:large subunit ribosomal protein L6
MSRIGKQPVALPSGVKVSVQDRTVTVESGSARLSMTHRPEVAVRVDGQQVLVERADDQRASRAYHGLTRALIQNMVVGVTSGFKKELEIVGVGWNAQVRGKTVVLNVGYADAKEVTIPDGVTVQVAGNKVSIAGPDRQSVGQCAAEIRSKRKPEPYNGRGIKYVDEVIVRKQGKAFASGG